MVGMASLMNHNNLIVEQNVFRFQVAVYNSLIMQMFQGESNFRKVKASRVLRERERETGRGRRREGKRGKSKSCPGRVRNTI